MERISWVTSFSCKKGSFHFPISSDRNWHHGLTINHQKQPTEVFSKKGVLRNFAKFIAKHLGQRLLFNRVAGRPAILLRVSSTGVFIWIWQISKNSSFSQNTSGRLLLNHFIYYKISHPILLITFYIKRLSKETRYMNWYFAQCFEKYCISKHNACFYLHH